MSTGNTLNSQPEVPYDLLLKGGQVIDPKRGTMQLADVAIAGERIARVERDIPPAQAKQVLPVQGYYVTPGLIDMHVHVFPCHFDWSLVADAHSFRSGVTTMVDAGSGGVANFQDFLQSVVEKSKTRVLAYLNVVDNGMGGDWEQDVSRMLPEATAEVAKAYPDVIVGIKAAHYWTARPWDATHAPWDNVERAVRAGELAQKPVMVDFWPRPPERSYEDLLLKKLRPGDIHTHVFGQHFPIIDEAGKVNPVLFQARRRGIIFDVGHGAGSFWFRHAVRAIAQGFIPDSISTDLHIKNVNGPVLDTLTTMSKFLNMGLSLQEVIYRTTVTPAQEIGHPELGTLDVGAEADVAVLALREGDFVFTDCGRAKMRGDKRLECILTVRKGEIVYDPRGLSMPEWEKAPAEYWAYKPPSGP